MGLVIPSGELDDIDFFATRGFSSPAVSKLGAGIQTARLGYKVAKYAYKRYFGYATRTRSRAAGTGSGAGIGIGGGLIAFTTPITPSANRIGQTRGDMGRLRSGLQRTNRQITDRPCPPRRRKRCY